MSSTFSGMTSRIADDINRTDLTTQIQLAINRAIEYFSKNYRFWFNEKTATFVTVASQFAYSSADSIPTDMMDIDLVKITLASNNLVPLYPRTYDYIQTRNTGNLSGVPEEYAYYKQSFYLYPIPNAVYTITVSYPKSYAALSAGSDTNDYTTYAEDLIEARATWWIYNRILKDYDAAAISKQEELDALIAITAETERVTSTNRLKPTSF